MSEGPLTSPLPQAGNEQAVDVSTPKQIRQVDDAGVHLPFVTKHPNRWNSANDGTAYEPCTALGAVELGEIGVDYASVRDAAGTDGQSLRGCRWDYLGEDFSEWTVSQFVGNSPGLEADKRAQRSSVDVWMPDINIEGRVVGIHRLRDGLDCATHVESGHAAVNTLVVYTCQTSPPVFEICDRAIAFTKATIDKIPR